MTIKNPIETTPSGANKSYQQKSEKASSGNPFKNFDPFGEDTTLSNLISNIATVSSGFGKWGAEVESTLSGFDKFGINPTYTNHVISGYTFITRPKLCLATPNLKHDRIMASLINLDPQSYAVSIRNYLDTNLSLYFPYWQSVIKNSRFLNDRSPFIIPLSNCLRSISGFPDFVLDTLTTQGGYFEEDQTTAAGSDFNARSYDLSLEFIDIPGSYVLALLYFWIRYMALVTRGQLTVYYEDIIQQRLCYTCSIYRFILDPTRRQIIGGCKATGCFPKAVPLGAYFDVNDKEHYVQAAERINVPFQVNTVEYFDYVILKEFNMVVDRFMNRSLQVPRSNTLQATQPTFGDMIKKGQFKKVPLEAPFNYIGTPYIDVESGYQTLSFYAPSEDIEEIKALTDLTASNNLKNLLDGAGLEDFVRPPEFYNSLYGFKLPSSLSSGSDNTVSSENQEFQSLLNDLASG